LVTAKGTNTKKETFILEKKKQKQKQKDRYDPTNHANTT